MDLIPQKPLPNKITSDDVKISRFARFYLDKDNPETYGHATMSAVKAFGYKLPEQYATARTIGSKYLTRINNVAQEVMLNHGATLPYMVQFALNEMTTTKSEKMRGYWWSRLIELGGIKKQAEIQINNTFNSTNNTNIQQNNLTIAPEEQKKWNAQFLDFMNKGGELPA